MAVLELEIIGPTSAKKLTIKWVEIESPTGSFLVGPGHIPLVSIIKKKSILLYQPHDAEATTLEVDGGIFSVADNKAIAILD
ncbi:hypothetical protein K2W90_04820 [Candidatus Babeliales bacterium]|nr:hypothetical protein [Candidatus Babeliales bacterium]